MAKNNKTDFTPLAVDITTLQSMLGLSKNKSMQVGRDAGAVINLGMRRTLYNVSKIQAYIDSKTGCADQE